MKVALVVVVLAVLLVLVWRLKPESPPPISVRMEPIPVDKLQLSETPDTPVSFGYKMAWLAINEASPEPLVAELGLSEVVRANWSSGISAVYDDMTTVYVSPPVGGWVLVVGLQLPELGSDLAPVRCGEFLQNLANKYEDVQYFATHRVVEYHAWSRYVKGKHVRSYAYLGERGETLLDLSEQSFEEVQLGFRFFDEHSQEASRDSYWEREDLRFPREDDVMKLAGKWSLDPTSLDGSDAEPSLGWLGRRDPRWSAN
jgi:hypothetical protein